LSFAGLARYEWLLFEFAVVGWAAWELWSLRRDRLRAEREKAAAEKPAASEPGVADPPQSPGG
jgi:hypothetical protein